jgi:hypothetical protein
MARMCNWCQDSPLLSEVESSLDRMFVLVGCLRRSGVSDPVNPKDRSGSREFVNV